jgi:ABC-type transport system involved in multi-copper enzyme maturation permease subunit
MAGEDHRRDGVGAAMRRLWLVARHTLTEALRLRLAVLFTLAGGALVVMTLWLREFNFGAAELKFIADFGLGAIGLLGMLLAALATAQLHFDELENGFAACVLAKAVRRGEYLGGRLAGIVALLALFVALLGLVLAVLVGVREAQLDAKLVPLSVFVQACALVWLKVTLVAAMTLLVCSYAGSALFAGWAGLMLAAIAHLRAFADGTGWLGWLRCWPDLTLFDVDPLLASGRGLTWTALASLGGYWLAFMFLFTGLAAYVFKQREL